MVDVTYIADTVAYDIVSISFSLGNPYHKLTKKLT